MTPEVKRFIAARKINGAAILRAVRLTAVFFNKPDEFGVDVINADSIETCHILRPRAALVYHQEAVNSGVAARLTLRELHERARLCELRKKGLPMWSSPVTFRYD